MLGLLSPTDPDWVLAAERNLDRLLSDHAHCELKAAQTALSLVARFGGEWPEIVAPLVALAHEEIEHFGQVQSRLAQRGEVLGTPDSDAYVTALRKAVRRDRDAFPALLDRLLISALIEARSCERFKLLSEGLSDGSMRTFYRDLMTSEAGHFRLFSKLAEERFGISETRSRLRTLASRESEVASELPLGPTVHG